MSCRGRCFSLSGVQGKPVVHEEAGQNGLTWYFCPTHRLFHALFLFSGATQPLCGECAVLFFDRTHHAVWVRQYDLDAVMSNTSEVVENARADFDALLLEMEQARGGGRTDDPLSPLHDISPDILSEIPKQDPTYTGLSTSLIPHKRIPGLFLLEYRTFHGAAAYQPCSRNMDTCGIFDSLRPIDQDGDPIFKQARVWSCVVQASPGLPKELRWVLATMYNFCNEMLRPENDEEALWHMRPWLMHWYQVAEQLLERFLIFASTPDIDWFARPLSRVRSRESHEATAPGETHQCASDSSSGPGTVLRRRHDSSDEQNWISQSPIGDRVAAIHAWLAQQPNLQEVDAASLFDPTPSGYVSSKTRRSMARAGPSMKSGNGRSVSSWSRLDPRAAVFDPWREQKSSPGSTEKDSLQESDPSVASDEDSDKQTERSGCSCLPTSNCRMLPYAGYGAPGLGFGLGEVAEWSLIVGLS